MSGSLGEIYFALGLDDKKFDDALEAAKQKVEQLGANASVGVKIDVENIGKQIRDELAKYQGKDNGLSQKVKIDFELTNLKGLEEEISRTEERIQKGMSMKVVNQSDIDRAKGYLETLKSQKRLEDVIERDLINIQDTAGAQYGVKIGDDIMSGLKQRLLKGERPSELILEPNTEKVKPIRLDVELNQETVNAVKQQLAELGVPITKTVNVELGEQKVQEQAKQGEIIQHVINESDIAEVKALSEAMKGLNEQMEVQNRLKMGQMESAERNKAEKQALDEEKALNEFIEKARKRRATAANKEAQIEKEAAKETNKALKEQLAQLYKLEEAIRKLQNMKVSIDASDIDKDSDNYRNAIALIDAYIDKLEQMQSSGTKLNKRSVSSVLGQDMKAMEANAKRYIATQKKVDEELENTKSGAVALGEVLGNVFNYYMIERFVRNLYTIGGEFQKQQIALRAMIGDVDKANSIFERTKEMAVMSPFTFSELASYTKQMSAYGLEYEELYDTTKRLADISAGVGVDMGRLILAFGQVRSAAVLRGQELRQFTEAGIPMVNELAKAFSNLENREVKAAEVFDKISRREVSFGMVRDVLFEMTDPGGRFFEMQEELAQSLAGQWSNLKDAWEIMIADIAESTNGPLNILASMMRSIISDWRKWIPLISGAAVGITALNAGLKITNALASASIITQATATALNPWLGALAAISAIGAGAAIFSSSIETATEAQKRLTAEMESSLTKVEENERTANRYLDTLSKTATKESEKEALLKRQKVTLEVLRSMYGDVLKDVQLEELTTEKILELREGIKNATNQQSEELIQNNVDTALNFLNGAQKKLEDLQNGTVTDFAYDADGKLIKVERKASKSEIDDAIKNVQRFQDAYDKAISRQQEFWNRQEDLAQEDLSGWREKAEELIKGTTLQAPKEDQSIKEYFKYLKEEYDAGKEEFELYAEDNPITADNKKSAKALRDAANRVNVGLGGVSFLQESKTTEKDDKGAERRAKQIAQTFTDALQEELKRISNQWDLYKQLFEATGDKNFAMTAFSVTPIWDEAAIQMRSALKKAMKEKGLDFDLDFDISDTDAKVVYGDFYNSWKQIKDRIEKNGIDLKINTGNAIKDAMSIQEQIEAETNKKWEALIPLQEDTPEYTATAEKFDKTISDLKAQLFALSPAFTELFVDTTGLARTEVQSLYERTKKLVELVRNGQENRNKDNVVTGYSFTDENGKVQEISIDKFKELLRLLDSLEDKSEKLETPLTRIWDALRGKGKLGGGEKKGTLEGALEDMSALAEATAQASQELSSMFDSLGNEDLADAFSFAGDMLNGVGTLGKAAASFASGDILGGIYGGISGVTGIISSIAGMHDKKLDKAIKKSQLEVQKLENAYSQLERTIERQLEGVSNDQAIKMLESLTGQRAELAKQYELEDEKKKTDKSKLEDYKNQIAELDDQIKYFYEDWANEQYGVDIKGWASQIAEALTEAFASGEDAAKSFDNTVAGILRELATEAIRLQFIQPAMENLRNFMFGSNGIFTIGSENGMDLSEGEAEGLAFELDKLKGQIEASNDYWDKINEATGGILDSTSSSQKEGLSKSIQSVTEDTANLLGSYLNSIRADSSVKRSLIEKLITEDVPQMSFIAQAQLQQLQMIVTNTKRNADTADRIYDLVNRVVDKGSNKLKI